MTDFSDKTYEQQQQSTDLNESENDNEYESSNISTLGINLAPDVESNEPVQNESEIIIRKQQIIHQQQAIQQKIQLHQVQMQIEIENQQHQNHDPLYKKKYAKEAWPGR